MVFVHAIIFGALCAVGLFLLLGMHRFPDARAQYYDEKIKMHKKVKENLLDIL